MMLLFLRFSITKISNTSNDLICKILIKFRPENNAFKVGFEATATAQSFLLTHVHYDQSLIYC